MFRADFVGEVESGTGPKDAFDGSAQVSSPCEDNVNGGLVDGLVEGRTGVQVERVESEVVLICERNNMDGVCDMPCDEMKRFMTTLQVVLSHTRKNHVCGSVKRACLCEWVECGVHSFVARSCGR